MATYGEIRMRLVQMHPAVSLDLLDGWITDRHQQILDRLDWQRLDTHANIAIPIEVSAGTVAVTLGSDEIVGAGTAWTSAIEGRVIRIAGDEVLYGVAFQDDTHITLDRPYEGTTAAAAGYRINQNVFPLDVDVRYVKQVIRDCALTRKSLSELNSFAPRRAAYGTPTYWAPYMDHASDPPVAQVELYPIPTEASSFVCYFVADAGASELGVATGSMLPWVREGALIAGVSADVLRLQKDWNGADRMEGRFEALVLDMTRTDASRQGSQRMQLDEYWTRHYRQRWMR